MIKTSFSHKFSFEGIVHVNKSNSEKRIKVVKQTVVKMFSFKEDWLFTLMTGQCSILLWLRSGNKILVLCLYFSFTNSLVYNQSHIQLFLEIKVNSLLNEVMENLFLFFNKLSITHRLGVTWILMCERKESLGYGSRSWRRKAQK